MSIVTCLADVEAIETVPLPDRHLPASTFDMLKSGAALAPARPALSFFLRSQDHRRPYQLTYGDLLKQVTRTANLFARLGIGRGDVVALLLPNMIETHLAIWGGEAAGIAFPINPLLEACQIARLLNAARARLLVTLGPAPGSDIWDKALDALTEAPGVEAVLQVDPLRYLRSPAAPLVRSVVRFRERHKRPKVRTLDFSRELQREPMDRLTFASPTSSDRASCFATGGTTGLPKLAWRTHGAEVYDAWACATVLGAMAHGTAVFCGLPLFHVNGQIVTGLAPLGVGAHVILATPQGYRGAGVFERFWEIVEHHRIAFFSGVPTVYSKLMETPVGGRDISSLQLGLCGAAPMPVELFRRFEVSTGVRILEGYGLTEGTCVSSVNPPGGERRIGSVGLRLPYQRMQTLILDEAGHHVRDAAVGEVGVLAIRGPNLFLGYGDPLQEKGLWIDRQGERWLNTGDLARQDSDGYFWLVGRKKELIIRGGHNIDPKVIEEALAAHRDVAMAAAVGRPDKHAGEVPVAYVQLRPGGSVAPSLLMDHAAAFISERAARPKSVEIVSTLPLTGVGKVFKPELVGREIIQVIKAECETLGMAEPHVDILQTPDRGLLAAITTKDDPERLKPVLDRYTFAWSFVSAEHSRQSAKVQA